MTDEEISDLRGTDFTLTVARRVLSGVLDALGSECPTCGGRRILDCACSCEATRLRDQIKAVIDVVKRAYDIEARHDAWCTVKGRCNYCDPLDEVLEALGGQYEPAWRKR